MIEIKTFTKAKTTSGTMSGASGGGGSVGSYVQEANHAYKADIATKAAKATVADTANYADKSGHAARADYAVKSSELDENGESAKKFLRRDIDDTAQGIITFLQGLKVGDTGNNEITTEGLARLYAFITYGFQSGLYGTGAQIDHKGNAELNSLFVRQFISTPKFVFNEIAVTKAEQWNTNGYGTIESVDLENQQITLKLEENDYGSLSEGDICRGIFADIDNAYGSDSTTEGALDEQGFVMHKGFFTTYFYVKRIITSEKGKFVFEYGKKSTSTPDPCAYMDFAQYGSFTDDQRQSSMYFSSRGRSYIEVLDGVNTWEIKSWNRVCRYGYLGGLSLQKKDGSYFYPNGNGLYAQDNVYFGGTVTYLKGIEGLDDIKEEAKSYDVSLSQYQSVLTVDDMGNVIDGLYSVDEGQSIKQYKVTTAVFVRKGQDILLEEDDSNEDVTEGHYRVYAVSNECTVEIKNSTVFVTAIENIKDGVAGTDDDTDFDYDQMRKMTDAMVTIVVDLEGKTSKTVQMPIRIQHDSLPFMVCDLSNENASVAWNTKTSSYIGFPIETKVSLFYQNTPYTISSLNINTPAGLKASMSLDGKAKTITVEPDNLTSDSLPQVSKLEITVTGVYAGASYEYTKELTVVKTADTVVYEVVPSADNVTVDASDNMSTTSLSCRVFATSSDDKRYELTSLPSGFALKYAYDSDTPTTSLGIGKSVSVGTGNTMVTFGLYDASCNELDKESVPVVKDGKKGADGAKGDKGDTGRGISSVTTRYYTNSSSTSAPSSSSFFSSSSSDTTPADWGDSYPWLWKLVRTYYTDGTYSDAIVCVGYKAKDGSTGSDGRGIVSVDTYYLISASNTGVDLSTTGWSTSMVNPTSSKPYLWSYVKTTYSDQTSDRSTPVIIGNFAEAGPMGKMGCTVRTSIWQSGVEYHNDSALTTEPKYIDVVYVENSSANGGYDVYQCETTHTSSGSAFSYDTSKWTKLSDVGPIYSPLIVAKNAAIKFSQSQQINLVYNNAIFGSFRYVDSTADYAFWLGGSTGATATTSITRAGALKATNATITGTINATAGQIAGMKISGDALTNEGFDNDAYIVLRNDTNNVFAGIGGNVLPATTGTRAVARFENNKTGSYYSINYAMYLSASGATDNVAIDIEGGCIMGLRIKTAFMSAAAQIAKGVNSVCLSASGTYTLPNMGKEDDGYMIMIKRTLSGEGDTKITLKGGTSVDAYGDKYTSFILADLGAASASINIQSIGDAMILVYHRSISPTSGLSSSTYQGAWVQYKCPRNW